MLVVLRMNRDFMKYMRKYYAHIDRSSFKMLITALDNTDPDDETSDVAPSGEAVSGKAASGGAASRDGAAPGRGASAAKSAKTLQQQSLTSLFGKKASPK